MILLCAGERSERAFDALLLLALQLDLAGHVVGIDARFMPDEVQRNQKFEAALYLCDAEETTPETIVIIGADNITDDVQVMLRALNPSADTGVFGLGRFADHESLIRAQNRLAFGLGREAVVINLLSDKGETDLIEDSITPFLTKIAPAPVPSRNSRPGFLVYMPFEEMEEGTALPELAALSHSDQFDLHIVTTGRGKDFVRRSKYAHLSVFGNSELPPTTLLSYTDIVAVFGPGIPGPRMAQFVLDVMGAGKVVIDCTEEARFLANGAPALKGPADVQSLASYIEATVLPHRDEIGRRIQQSPWLAKFDLAHLEQKSGLKRPAPRAADGPHATVFFPTNGNGLGHAQRCSLIAKDMPADHDICFAAFPSCVGMLKNKGFDCLPMVQRHEDFTEEYANDLINYRRLNAVISAGDQLVFDGGYVFDSVYRVISASRNPAVWIRRGLWQPGQVHANALEREHIFSKVIVPTEAFDELNTDYSFGPRNHHVGPIVNVAAGSGNRKTLREKLSTHFDRPIETLVITMLGGGVASDRTVQTQMMCSILERRKNCLHLVVAWPGAVVPDGIYGWANTQVVQTENTLDLCRAADLVVSAAGYNSFHELIYAGAPTIFIPQSAPYLDDQEKRARAASERGLAALVLEAEMMSLGREVDGFLDGDTASDISAAHATLQLPETGNSAAADLIAKGLDT